MLLLLSVLAPATWYGKRVEKETSQTEHRTQPGLAGQQRICDALWSIFKHLTKRNKCLIIKYKNISIYLPYMSYRTKFELLHCLILFLFPPQVRRKLFSMQKTRLRVRFCLIVLLLWFLFSPFLENLFIFGFGFCFCFEFMLLLLFHICHALVLLYNKCILACCMPSHWTNTTRKEQQKHQQLQQQLQHLWLHPALVHAFFILVSMIFGEILKKKVNA